MFAFSRSFLSGREKENIEPAVQRGGRGSLRAGLRPPSDGLVFGKVPKTISRDFETVAEKRPKRPTVCVTCAGAGTAKPSSQKNDKACKTA